LKSLPSLQSELQPVIDTLAADTPLPLRNRDHQLKGEWTGFRDCHIRPDLVLIYRKFEPQMLELNRLGSHSELLL
jgi:mRNA interferase YafQ